jgi:hypothetical protein
MGRETESKKITNSQGRLRRGMNAARFSGNTWLIAAQ